MKSRLLLPGFLAILLAWGPASATDTPPPVVHKGSGLPIPRFASLKSDEVNVRTGPGPRYPIDWVFVRKTMPVEVLAEVDTWRKVRSLDGTEGWVHQSMLTGRRTAIVIGSETRRLYKHNDPTTRRRLAPVS